jgi:hypothetical protein
MRVESRYCPNCSAGFSPTTRKCPACSVPLVAAADFRDPRSGFDSDTACDEDSMTGPPLDPSGLPELRTDKPMPLAILDAVLRRDEEEDAHGPGPSGKASAQTEQPEGTSLPRGILFIIGMILFTLLRMLFGG